MREIHFFTPAIAVALIFLTSMASAQVSYRIELQAKQTDPDTVVAVDKLPRARGEYSLSEHDLPIDVSYKETAESGASH